MNHLLIDEAKILIESAYVAIEHILKSFHIRA